MMKSVAKAIEPAERQARFDHIQPHYLEALTLIERLHRRLLDVIKDEFDRKGRADINAVQALLLFNIGDKELTAGELRTRGYYLGSNVSYNLKKLVEMGFLDHQRSRVDRRSVRIKLTEKGADVRETVRALYEKHVRTVEQVGGINADEFAGLNKALHRLERFWTDQILVSAVSASGSRIRNGAPDGAPFLFVRSSTPHPEDESALTQTRWNGAVPSRRWIAIDVVVPLLGNHLDAIGGLSGAPSATPSIEGRFVIERAGRAPPSFGDRASVTCIAANTTVCDGAPCPHRLRAGRGRSPSARRANVRACAISRGSSARQRSSEGGSLEPVGDEIEEVHGSPAVVFWLRPAEALETIKLRLFTIIAENIRTSMRSGFRAVRVNARLWQSQGSSRDRRTRFQRPRVALEAEQHVASHACGRGWLGAEHHRRYRKRVGNPDWKLCRSGGCARRQSRQTCLQSKSDAPVPGLSEAGVARMSEAKSGDSRRSWLHSVRVIPNLEASSGFSSRR